MLFRRNFVFAKLVTHLPLTDLTDEGGEPVSLQQAILYNAVIILRAEISQIEPSDRYTTPREVSLQRSAAFVPQMLQTFILWLVNTETYDSMSTDCLTAEAIRRRCFSIAECIVFNCSKVITPLQVGLAAQLHNTFESRHLTDTLHLHGFCMSYDDLRRLMTSSAEVEIETLQQGVYVPNGTVSITEGGNLIHEGDDNIDINVETVNEKNTFHSMVVFQESTDSPATRKTSIKHGKSKALAFCEQSESLMECVTFKKQKIRAEPVRIEKVLEKMNSYKTGMNPFPDLV